MWPKTGTPGACLGGKRPENGRNATELARLDLIIVRPSYAYVQLCVCVHTYTAVREDARADGDLSARPFTLFLGHNDSTGHNSKTFVSDLLFEYYEAY
jgi:hypothetical protein